MQCAEPETIADLYGPPVSHKAIENDDEEFDTHRIAIDGITVRYLEKHAGIVMTVEGILPEATIDALLEDLCGKLSRIEGKRSTVREIGD